MASDLKILSSNNIFITEIMKRILFSVLLCSLSVCIFAQSDKVKTVKKYVEIYAMFKTSTPIIDTGEGKGKETYMTEDGNEVVFHSAIGAVNWFVANGWELVSEHMSTCNDRSVKMYVVSKEIPFQEAKIKENKYIKK